MTNLPTVETSRAPLPEGPGASRPAHPPEASAAPSDGQAEAQSTTPPRESPDPLVATDRYRLTMPFTDRV